MSATDCGSPPSIRIEPAGVWMRTALSPLTPTYELFPNSRNGTWGWFHASQESQAMGAVSSEGASGPPAASGELGFPVAARAAAAAARTIQLVIIQKS